MLSTIAAMVIGYQGQLVKNDLTVGKGETAKMYDFVTVDYVGKLTNGKVFDQSIGRAPFSFMLGIGQVIKGWDQGVAGMKVGGKRKLTIPASLGYGAQGAPPDIPGGATLVFEVTLRKVQRAKITVLKAGTGKAAKVGSDVRVHYRGTLADGKEFDSSYKRNEPLPVRVATGQVVPGFDQGLLGIKKGEKRKVVIPYELAYGERGMPPVIPAKANLTFELECVEVR